jgi:putative aldouronate transport system substrate-binding protein
MSKKLFYVALTAVMAFALLAGCGQSGANNPPAPASQPAASEPAAAAQPAESGTTAEPVESEPAVAAQPAESAAEAAPSVEAEVKDGGLTYLGHDVSKSLNLTAYVLGDLQPDGQEVYDRINDILRTTINATIDWKYLSWAEHDTKYSLLFTSQEDFDIIFTAPIWAHYEQTVGMGGFEPMTPEFVQEYAPDLWAIMPEEAWSQTKIDGVSYCVPSGEAVLRSDVNAVRGDLMEAAGISDITTYDQLLEFFDWVAKHQAETGVSPFGPATSGFLYTYFDDNKLALLSGTPYEILYYNYLDPNNTKVEYLLDQAWFKGYCEDMKKYFEAGWWSQDSLASTSTFQENFLRGQAATFSWNIGSVLNFLRQADEEHPEWKATFVDAHINGYKWVEDYNNNDMAINAFSKNKERAMMALNELYCNKEVNRLIRYGVEGVHYTNIDDEFYAMTDRSNSYPPGGNCPAWACKNETIALELYIENPTPYELKEREVRKIWEQHQVPPHPLNRFTLDTTEITTQIAMINTIKDQYFIPLVSGMAGDVDAAIEQLRSQLEQAGVRDVLADAERQIQGFLAGR